MKLSNAEKLILTNQYEILMLLNPAKQTEYQAKLNQLKNNEVIKQQTSQLDEEDMNFVNALLSLYNKVYSYAKNVAPVYIKSHDWAVFNKLNTKEALYLSYAEQLIKQGKYQNLVACNLIGRGLHTNKYHKMVNKYKELVNSGASHIGEKQWLDILNA
ncbi:YfbU family protein [Thiotrichales bacterium 19X7-9]|nr:YfbU family protein [Thiotrichales bacterium 19X7-9]